MVITHKVYCLESQVMFKKIKICGGRSSQQQLAEKCLGLCVYLCRSLYCVLVIIYFDAIFMAMCRGMNSTLTTLFLVYVFLSNVNEKWKIETFLCYPCN